VCGPLRVEWSVGSSVAVVILVVAATARELGDLPGLLCGVGPVEAAAATARSLAVESPDAVLHVGIAGCRRGCGLEPPQLVIGGEAVYDDVVVPLAPRRVAPDPRLVEAALRALPGTPVLPIGTSGTVGGTRGHDVEAMEGFAVLRACELAGVPAVEVRAIANEIEEPDRALWRFDDAFAALAQALPRLVESITVVVSA
jgi:futalosine hydrolase